MIQLGRRCVIMETKKSIYLKFEMIVLRNRVNGKQDLKRRDDNKLIVGTCITRIAMIAKISI